jgi:DNA-binding PadR family transcriptional regulator
LDFLRHVGFWFVDSQEAREHEARIKKSQVLGLISLRPHRTTDGKAIKAYELTDDGLDRLAQIAGEPIAAEARSHRDYFRDQARRHRWA